VIINIDLQAVGNWAERRGIAYASYQELAALSQVYDLIGEEIEQVNADLAQEPNLAGSQIHRFLVLHKELDPDDGELTRTRKVRRGFVAEKYAPIIDALYSGGEHCQISTEVTFEDGRKGVVSADLAIRDTRTVEAAAPLAAE
jgi:long-chain acyl-CoA synthetase